MIKFEQSSTLRRSLLMLAVVLAPGVAVAQQDPGVQPVLMVIANQDFYYEEYHQVRASLEAAGLEVVVAATSATLARPQDRDDGTVVRPDVALADAHGDDYSAIVFSGGWGMASYQYATVGTYDNAGYRPGRGAVEANRLINEMLEQGKPVAAVCYGVSVLAWARVDGVSPLDGRTVVGWAGGRPAFSIRRTTFPDAEVPMRWDIEENGALMLTSSSVGDPLTDDDDVWVDGQIITVESHQAADKATTKIQEAIAKG